MKIRFILSFFVFILILVPGTGRAFVPQTPHLLYLMIQKIKQPVGIQAFQTKTIVDADASEEQDAVPVRLDEMLIYQYPNRLRAELSSPVTTSFSVESGFDFIKVVNGEAVSREKSAMDLYTDVLLYRNHESLLGQLSQAGVDVSMVTFQRFEGTICYVIGKPLGKDTPFSGLWIEKETLFPVKYTLEKDDWIVDCVYGNWQKVSKTWYPLQTRIFLDNQLYATIDVNDISLKAGNSPKLFDIGHIVQRFPQKKEPERFDPGSGEMDELDKRIEEFKKLYE